MEEKMKISAIVVQTVSTLCLAMLTTLTGFVYAWPSYTLANFVSNETVLSAPMTTAQISLLGSLTNIGALVATPFCGCILDKVGRKYAAMLFGLPSVLAWSVISVTTSVPLVLVAVGFAGIGAGGQVVTTVYIAEISQDSIRGALTSTTASGYFLGLLFSYVLGGWLSYHQVVYVHLTGSILYILLVAALKESPVFLMQRGREKEAAQSVAFYRHVAVTSKEVEVEIAKLKLQLEPRVDTILSADNDAASKQLINTNPKEKVKAVSAWQFLKKSESSKRGLATVLIVMTLSILMGSVVLQVYAEPLFKEAVSSMDSNLCSILMAVDLLAACMLCSLLLDKLGRKFLMTWTSVASGVMMLLLGTQVTFHWAPHWFTAALIFSFSFIYNMGAAVVPFVLTGEVFLPEVRGLGNTISMGCMWTNYFMILLIFNPLVEAIGLGAIFCCFSIVCFAGAAYGWFCLPETKGMSADAIQVLFQKKPRVTISA